MLYSLVKPVLFAVDAELAHEVSLGLLEQFHRLIPQVKVDQPVEIMGLQFPNQVGLAAGLDKNADYLNGLSRLGFGFIEVGSITPLAQSGNPKPRLFRLIRDQSIINRMGFNNKGVDYLLNQVRGFKHDFILGINIGKNLITPVEQALLDYRICLQKVYFEADYISINISSPNTPGLRKLQGENALEDLLKGLDETRRFLEDEHQFQRPMALKIAPDLDSEAISRISDLLHKYRIDGLIATNTTLDRTRVQHHPNSAQAGGLSGAALCDRSRQVLSQFHERLKDEIPIISVGGIDSVEEAQLRLDLGAKLVQLYSGLIYQGPSLVKNILQSLASSYTQDS
jgi:dihydroorotate dehydrogenase